MRPFFIYELGQILFVTFVPQYLNPKIDEAPEVKYMGKLMFNLHN